MLLTFGEIRESILSSMGVTTSTVDPSIRTEIERRINTIQSYIWYDRLWEWRKRPFYLTTKPPYNTGTASITKGSKTLTGSGTTFTPEHTLGYLMATDKLYRVKHYTSATSLGIASEFPETSLAGGAYNIYFPDYVLSHDITAIVNIKYRGKDLRVVGSESMLLDGLTAGKPQEACISRLSEDDFYTTGTVAVSNGSTSVVGDVNTSFASYMVGMNFRTNEWAEPYTIKSIDIPTRTIVLTERFQGESGSGKSYTIGPKGFPVLTIANIPDDYYWLDIQALIRPKRLVSATDVSLIPNHAPLIHGALWLALNDLENKNPVRIQQARADFERSMKELRDTYKAVNNVQWLSSEEVATRKNGGLGNYDPFSR